ncbi:hypothetical protein BU26DRAFT_568818 [Trematosphaeria pertusa]|uniref:Uncharacterized protein n=1 Tax=Trematosphaeria pertusa TaxID=390896 RepID=A0A6A6I5I2_9PLEO|nr:uncharacterized protein BU26DRAFT_568818 [Trematosphaeria pertusa]KAF2244823.1 hypothetical protein BU26DRAFT_568818 [Trematosphaeria pertusa]
MRHLLTCLFRQREEQSSRYYPSAIGEFSSRGIFPATETFEEEYVSLKELIMFCRAHTNATVMFHLPFLDADYGLLLLVVYMIPVHARDKADCKAAASADLVYPSHPPLRDAPENLRFFLGDRIIDPVAVMRAQDPSDWPELERGIKEHSALLRDLDEHGF